MKPKQNRGVIVCLTFVCLVSSCLLAGCGKSSESEAESAAQMQKHSQIKRTSDK